VIESAIEFFNVVEAEKNVDVVIDGVLIVNVVVTLLLLKVAVSAVMLVVEVAEIVVVGVKLVIATMLGVVVTAAE
jgi:hypothetical protein